MSQLTFYHIDRIELLIHRLPKETQQPWWDKLLALYDVRGDLEMTRHARVLNERLNKELDAIAEGVRS